MIILFPFSDNPVCSVNAINGGQEVLSVSDNTATLEFEGTGPNATHAVTNFICRLDRRIGNGRFVEVENTEQECIVRPGMLLKLAAGLCV